MAEIAFTPKQLEAIELGGKDMCVVAGPGAGKTAVLIERFIRLIGAGISIHRILAITFTEKAATQLRERLNRKYAGTPLESQIERAWITTVDGFCARLLRENAIAAGVDPEFRIIDEREAPEIQYEASTDALDALLAERPGPMRELLSQLASPDVGRALLAVYAAMRACGTSIASVRARPLPGVDGWERLVSEAAAIVAEPPRGTTAAQRKQADRALEWARATLNLANCPPDRRHFEALAAFPNGRLAEALRAVRDERLAPALEALAGIHFAGSRELLFDALEHFETLYRRRKFESGGLDFADLEDCAVQLLEHDDAVRERVRGQFEHVMMDEFQDTNRQQARLMGLVRPPDRFYAVGDINQSIYGFRNADPDVFREYRATVEKERVVELRANFRSRPEILAAVLTVLDGASGIEPHVLSPGREFPAKTEPSLELICSVADEGARELEAKWVARRVRELEGRLMLRKGPARFGDFALLVRNSGCIPLFAREFEAAGIPYQVDRGRGLFETREAGDAIALLRVLANPLDQIASATVLRSPLVGLSDQSLFRLRDAECLATALVRPDSAAAAGLEAEDRGKLEAFSRALAGWREQRYDLPASRLLTRALDRSGYQAGLTPRARANVDKLLGIVRFYAGRNPIDAVVEQIERLKTEAGEAEAAVPGAAEGVQVMTVHSAKGLEFPVVFLAALHKGVETRLDPVCFSPLHGLGARWRNPAGGKSVCDPVFSGIDRERSGRDRQESERLLYVGMTRAEEHLVLSSAGPPREWAAIAARAFPFDLETPAPARVEPYRDPAGADRTVRVLVADAAPDPSGAGISRPDGPAPEWFEPRGALSGQHDSTASVTSISLYDACPRRYYLSRYLGIEERRPAPFAFDEELPRAEPDALDASHLGIQVHAILAGIETGPVAPEALELAGRFHSSGLGRRAAAAFRSAREYDFVMAVEDVVLRGQIDLWFEHDDTLVLVDYKTDAVDLENAAAHAADYELQIRLYAIALERALGRTPDEAWLYFLRPDAAVAVALEPILLAEATGAVRDFRDAQDCLAFPVREGHRCRRCPFFHGLCPSGFGA
jgi:ATP-dependent helicase/nuclease subunit A